MSNSQDKVVLINGASSGIGEACARLLAQKGARPLRGARRTERLERLVGEIREAGGSAVVYAVEPPTDVDVSELIVRPTARPY